MSGEWWMVMAWWREEGGGWLDGWWWLADGWYSLVGWLRVGCYFDEFISWFGGECFPVAHRLRQKGRIGTQRKDKQQQHLLALTRRLCSVSKTIFINTFFI